MNHNSEKLSVLIIDDDLPSIQVLLDALSRRKEVGECRTATSLAEGTEILETYAPDLLFLDMEFPGSNGLDWYDDAPIPDRTKVVFYTGYQRYIHDALSTRVFDFLLKPFDPEELGIILTRAEAESRGSSPTPIIPRGAERGDSPLSLRSIAITTITNDKLIVSPSGILYFRYDSERKLWECVMTSLRRFILKRQSTAETILQYGTDFVRVHKKFIININFLGIISGVDCTLLPPYDNIKEIKMSKSYKRDLLDRFYDI